jgi:uncharacterized protein YndB with AHSA1/START domain
MNATDRDQVERSIELRAPLSRVWRAVSNAKDFGTWFGLGEPLELSGDFVPGAEITGRWRSPGGDLVERFCVIEKVEPERLLSFRWVPYEMPRGDAPAKHTHTLIELRLEPTETGTRLTITESGFSKLPADKQYKRDQNGEGWGVQLQSIAQHVLGGIDVKVQYAIARPVGDVFEAIVDPRKMSQYFITGSTGRLEGGAKLEWEWADVGAKCEVEVVTVEPRQKIVFVWKAAALKSKVTLLLEPDGAKTKLTAIEAPFTLSAEGAARALQQTQGWTDFCCSLKAYLEHGINLRAGKRADAA